ncbi:MAG: GNAT family N-acetyltransferase [Bacteroidota bacterium]
MEKPDAYPVKYVDPVLLPDGTLVQLRPIHPVDGTHAEEFREKLSLQSIYDRFLGYIPKISQPLIDRLTRIDYTREMALVAEVPLKGIEKEVIAVARIAPDESKEVEFAIIIADAWQGKGLGSIMTQRMIAIARDMGFEKMYALVFSHNQNMLDILEKQLFTIRPEDERTHRAILLLNPA